MAEKSDEVRVRKDDEAPHIIAAPEDAHLALAKRMSTVHISRSDELPRIGLYLDQLIAIVDDELSFMRLPGEKSLVTGSMVNNYVKRHVIAPPIKHRYTRQHVCGLICICAFKRVFSIGQISQVYDALRTANVDLEHAYDEICSALESSLAEQFAVGSDFVVPSVDPVIHLVDTEGAAVELPLGRTLEAAVVSLSSKVYVDQLLSLESAEK